MNKPSIAELLQASGYTEFTGSLFARASAALDGNLGINRDDRNWSQIMGSANPLAAAETALIAQWQNPAYLLSNAQSLVDNGTLASTVELTYRQMAKRLQFTYNPSWAAGTSFEALSKMSSTELSVLVASDVDGRTSPTITLTASAAGAALVLSHAGQASYSVTGNSGSANVGETSLSPAAALREGELTVTRDNGRSSTTTTYLYLGTNSASTVNYSGGATKDRLIVFGAGNDTLSAGSGNDTIYGGEGNDRLFTNQGNDLIYGQDGNDFIQTGQGNDVVFGGAGSDILDGGTSGNDELTGGSGGDQFRFATVAGKDTVKDFSVSEGDTIALYDGNGSDSEVQFAATGTANGAALSASDFDAVSTIAGIRADTGGTGLGNNQVYVITTAQTAAEISATVSGGATSAYALVFNSAQGSTSLYYDADWSDASGRVEIAVFPGLALSDLQTLTVSSFMAWA